jgi:hypothetical protein
MMSSRRADWILPKNTLCPPYLEFGSQVLRTMRSFSDGRQCFYDQSVDG